MVVHVIPLLVETGQAGSFDVVLVVQADLTAVAPGPLDHRVAGELRLLADQESRGAGGVYRFSPASLRRARRAAAS